MHFLKNGEFIFVFVQWGSNLLQERSRKNNSISNCVVLNTRIKYLQLICHESK